MSKIKILLNGFPIEEAHANYIKTSGTFNFYPTITITGSPSCINSALSIACYSKSNREVLIASKFIWSRIQTSLSDLVQNSSSYYHCSPKDLKFYIECLVTPVEEGFEGEGKIVYGPLAMDTETETQFQLAKKEDRYRISADGFFGNSKKPLSMIELKSNIIKALDHNLNCIGEIEIGPKTYILTAQNDPKKLKVFNAGQPEFNILTQNVLQKDVLMLLLENKKSKTGDLTNILPPNFIDDEQLKIAQIESKFPNFKDLSDKKRIDQSSNLQSGSRSREPYRKVFTSNIGSDINKKPPEWPSMKELALIQKEVQKEPTKQFPHQKNPDIYFEAYDNIKLHHSNDSYISGPQIQLETNKSYKGKTENPLHQKFSIKNNKEEFQKKDQITNKNDIKNIEISIRTKNENIINQDNFKRTQNDFDISGQKNKELTNRRIQAVNNLCKETKLEEVMKHYLDKYEKTSGNQEQSQKNLGTVQNLSSQIFNYGNNKHKTDLQIDKLLPENYSFNKIDEKSQVKKSKIVHENIIQHAKSETNNFEGSMLSFQPPKEALSILNEKNTGNKQNELPIQQSQQIPAISVKESKKIPEDFQGKLSQAFYSDYLNLKKTQEEEKAKLLKEIQMLKLSNKSLLREVEYLQGERLRAEDEAQIELNDKELQLLEEQTRLRESLKTMKRQTEQKEIEYAKKNQNLEATSSKLFELENSNFELRFLNTQIDEKLAKFEEHNIVLQKKLQLTEDKSQKLLEELSAAEDQVRKTNLLLLELEITQKTCKDLNEENQFLKSLIDDQRIETEKNDDLINNLNKHCDEKDNEIGKLQLGIFELKEKLLAKDREIEIKEMIKNDQNVKNELQEQYNELIQNFERIERENYHLNKNIELAEYENFRLRKTMNELKEQLSSQTQFNKLVEQEKEKLLSEETDLLRKEIKRLLENNKTIAKDLEFHKQEIEILKRSRNDLQFSNKTNLDKIDILQKQIEKRAILDSKLKQSAFPENQINNDPAIQAMIKDFQPTNLEEVNKRLRLKVSALISELRNERLKGKQLQVGQDYDNSESKNIHSRTYRADNLNESTNVTEKLFQLQKDYVVLIQENEKLRNDLYNVREEKFAMMDQFYQRKSLSTDNNGQEEELVKLLTPKDDSQKNGQIKRKNEVDKLKFEKIQDVNSQKLKSNLHNININDKEELIRHLQAKVRDLENKVLDSNFGFDDNNLHIQAKTSAFEKEKPTQTKSDEILNRDSSDVVKLKDILNNLLARYYEKPVEKFKEMTLNQLMEELKQIMKEVDGLKIEYLHLEKFVEEANQMIAKYELEKKELALKIEDLMEEKEILLETLQK